MNQDKKLKEINKVVAEFVAKVGRKKIEFAKKMKKMQQGLEREHIAKIRSEISTER